MADLNARTVKARRKASSRAECLTLNQALNDALEGRLYASMVTYHCDFEPPSSGAFPLAVLADSLDAAERQIELLADEWFINRGISPSRHYTLTVLMS